MKRGFIIIFLFFWQINGIKAQPVRTNFDRLTVDDGLSDNRIHTIYRDSRDFLWIGTTNHGLNKFDGHRVTRFEHTNQPGSLGSNSIRCVFEDSRKNLWVGTTDGLHLYDPRTETFKVFRHTNDSLKHFGNYISSLIEDGHGNLWIAFNEGPGLAKWDYETNSFIHYRAKNLGNDKIANSLTEIKEDSKGNLWVVSKGPGIYRFIPETGDFILYNDSSINFGKNLTKALCIDKNDKIWIGTFGNGMYSFDPLTGKFKHFGINAGNKGVNHHLVSDVVQTDDHHLWIATDQGGINIYDMRSNTFEYVTQDEKIEGGLNNNGILCLYKDKEGIIWAGTSRGGVNYHNPKEQKFKLYEHHSNSNSLSYNIVGCFYEDSEGLIWIGTDGGGLNVYNPKTGSWTIYKNNPTDPHSVSGNVIRCIDEDASHNIWIGTWDAGLNRYDRKTGKFYRYLHDAKDPSSILSNSTWYLKVDHKNDIWLASYSRGLEIFDRQKGVVKRFTADSNKPGSLSSNDVWMIYEDTQRNIWICTLDGINLYDSENHTFKVYNQFPDNDIRVIFRDRDGELWAGSTKNGLFLFEEDGTLVKVYDKTNGLPDNTVHAIVEDNSGNLWISTNNGISRFDKREEEFRNYVKSDGLQSNIFFQQSSLKTRQGEIYFGGLNGFNAFYPDSLRDNNFVPPVIFTEFSLFNKPAAIGAENSPLKYHINESEKITLSWKQSVFSFEFVGINYTNPEKNSYKYMLEGFDNEWILTDASRNYCTYTNLDPGKYTLRVKAANNDGIWNEQGKSIDIIITPPFSQTLGFKLIVAGFICGLVYLFFFLRTRRLRRNNAMLEKNVRERTAQLNSMVNELKEKQDEIETTNEELTSTLEDLYLQKNQVEDINNKLKSAQEELQQINEQLDIRVQERTQKLVKANQELDRFVYSASHDLSAPLKSILGLINITRLENKNRELQSHLNYMETSVLKLENVIKGLIQYSRNTGFQIKNDLVYFDQIVEEVLNEMNFSYDPRKVKIVKNYSKKEKVRTDILRLKIILQNLISNAIKYRKLDAEQSTVMIGFSVAKDEYQIQIKDDGIGINPQLREKIFTMFYRGTEQSDGSGLGLYIVKEAVNKLDGEIRVESEANSHTLVSISIPRQSDDDQN